MIIQKVELKNIKSYKNGTIDFQEGITSLYGLNGAGKSTIVEAIGFTLFDYSPPYNQSEFVRKGEKTGEITVTFTGSDGITYMVTRKCGSSQSYSIVDDKGIKLEGKEDVSAKLCEILGYSVQDIGQLSTLFENAVGVPQGTFVSEFLGTQSKRKPIFDPLMRIDEYTRAYENLLGLKNFVKDNLNTIDNEISRLTGKVEDRELRENEMAGLQKEKVDIEADLRTKNVELEAAKTQKTGMDTIELKIKEIERKQERARSDVSNQAAILDRHKSEMARAADAKDKMAQFEPGHRQYIEKGAALEALGSKKTEKDRITQALNSLEVTLAGLNAKHAGIEHDLKEMQKLESEIKGLGPAIVEQERLEVEQKKLAADSGAKIREKQQLLEKKKGLKGTTGNSCPLMLGVECKSVADLPAYFDKELKRLDGEILGLENENDGITSALKILGNPKLALGVKREDLKRREKLSTERDSVAAEISKKSPEREKIAIILQDYQGLEEQIKALNEVLRSSKPAHEGYQQYVKLAESFGQRISDVEMAAKALEKTRSELDGISLSLESSRQSYDNAAHDRVKAQCEELATGSTSLKARLEEKKRNLLRVENELDAIQKYLAALSELKEKRASEERYTAFIERTRRIIKDAGSMVIDRYLHFISAEATRLYREIAGDNRIEILWNRDYDIMLVEDGRERSFKQLSGGEQMSASLAVRLAIIKALMNSEIVFLDEPTQNLDESRRERLAMEIMRIKDFRQMIIISHDDTFNSALENVIEIEKVNGESRVRRRPGSAGSQATF